MQNYQSAIKLVSNQLKQRFDQLLLSETTRPRIQPVIIKRQMPRFQIDLFMRRSLESHFLVKLQLMPTSDMGQVTNVIGRLSLFKDSKILLTTLDNVTYLITPSLIRYIEKR
jgi:hypothetical protein